MPDDLSLDPSVNVKGGGDSPGIHALIIGVSYYDNLEKNETKIDSMGLGQLTASARTVDYIAAWLKSPTSGLAYPLKSLRVLASPSASEVMTTNYVQATLEHVGIAAKNWQKDASQLQDDIAFFYFAGHGIQRSRGDSVLLLQDFLGGLVDLDRTINVNNIYNGMANFKSLPNLARKQFYFIDACRTSAQNLSNYERQETAQIFRVEAEGVDDRLAPIFYSAAAGRQAFSMPGRMTLFGDNFLRCLQGGAADKIQLPTGLSTWTVTIGTLAEAMSSIVNATNRRMGEAVLSMNVDKYSPEGLTLPLCTLPNPPMVPCTLKFTQAQTATNTKLSFDPVGGPQNETFGPPCNDPLQITQPAGIYSLSAAIMGDQPIQQFVVVKAPYFEYSLPY